MKRIRLLPFVLAVLLACSLLVQAESYEELDFGKLKKAKENACGKVVMLKAGLGEIGSGSFKLDDRNITAEKYLAVKLYRPGKTKENINAYIAKNSDVVQMYQNYGTGDWLKRTCKKDNGVNVRGTLYYVGGKNYPVAMVIDKIEPTSDRPQGNLRYSITVATFENKANWSGQWNLGDGFTEIMTNALQDSGWFIVLGDKQMRREAIAEQDFGQSGRTARGKKTPKIGRMTPAQLLVKGAITHVQGSTTGGEGGLSFKGIQLGGAKDKAEINITIYLVDSETGQVKASTDVVGKSERKGGKIGYVGGALGGLTGALGGHKKDNVGKACEDAVAQAVDFLIKQLESIPWEGSIALVKGNKIIINRGQREGVNIGQKFSVGSVEQLVDEDTGEVLDVEMTKVGILEVTGVKEKIAYCKALEGGDKIKKGMTIQPVD